MEYRTLGKTGLKVSSIGIGTWQLSGPLVIDGKADGFPDLGEEQAIALIRAGEDLGINFIDSAEIYGDGEGERRIGKSIKGKRDRWIVSTKFGLRKGSKGEKVSNARPENIRLSLENSLTRLQTEYVDIYLYHAPPDFEFIEEGREVLETLKQQGKIRFYGISTNNHRVLEQLVEHNAVDVVLFSQSLIKQPSELLKLIKKHNLGSMIRGAMESGKLSGKYFDKQPKFSNRDIRDRTFQGVDTRKYSIYKEFLTSGVAMDVFALRYLLDFDTTHTIVLGGKSIEHYQKALQAFDLPSLEAKTHQNLSRVRQKLNQKPLSKKIINKVNNIFWRG